MLKLQRISWLFLVASSVPLVAQNSKPIVDFGIAAEGRIVPGKGLVTVAGQGIVTEVKVSAGDSVKKGDVLAVLEGAEAAKAGVKVAQAQADVAALAVTIADQKATALEYSVRTAQTQQKTAQSQLAEAQAGVDAAKKSMARALAEHDAANNNLAGQIGEYQRVVDELDPPRKDKEDLKVKQNMLGLEQAKLSETRQALEAELQAQVASTEATVQVAASQVSVANNQADAAAAEQTVAKQDVERVKKEAIAAQAAVEQAKIQANAFQVLAPMDGQIITVNVQAGETVGQNGVVFMGDTSQMFVEAQVYIDDIKRIKVGQKATVESEIFEKPLNGQVAEISKMVSPANLYTPDPTVFTDRRVVPVRIALDDDARAAQLIYAQVTVKISNDE